MKRLNRMKTSHLSFVRFVILSAAKDLFSGQETLRSAYRKLVVLGLVATLAVTGLSCSATPTPSPTPEPATPTVQPTATPVGELPLNVAIIWHQHQPLYYKDPETGVYQKPWVRVHATKDYLDMATTLEAYPDLVATFNVTPTLIRQLDDLSAGAKDLYWVLAEKLAFDLTTEDKRFILRRFFDTNRGIVRRFPRYQALLESRGDDLSDEALDAVIDRWTEGDFRDLQVLFNLAWTDPNWLAEEPLKGLVEKGRDFAEADKAVLFAEHKRIIDEVIPKHREMQDAGQIEVTMTPFAHPILPLLYDTDLAAVAMPDAPLPERFSYPQDAIAQVEMGVAFYRDHFGRDPRGMWPAEGSVAQEIVKFVSDAGIHWMAADEEVLAKSVGLGEFTRDSQEVVQEADTLFRPYQVQFQDGLPVAIVFREHRLSDKVGFEYSGMDGEVAARDLIDRLHAVRDRLEEQDAAGPHLVTVLLDGENAWEHYDNDGKKFLHSMYRMLSEDDQLQTVTPSQYLDMLEEPLPVIEDLWPGSWISHDFSTWIGEAEENKAWDYLRRTRRSLAQYTLYEEKEAPQEAVDEALANMYAAEGSDWFWWYGADQDSGDDRAFDEQFRAYLRGVYEALGEPVPDFVEVPVIGLASQPPDQAAGELFTPTVDGAVAPHDEWAEAGAWQRPDGPLVTALHYGFDAKNLYLRLDGAGDWSELAANAQVAVYLAVPTAEATIAFPRTIDEAGSQQWLGFDASHEVALRFADGGLRATLALPDRRNAWGEGESLEAVAAHGTVAEIAVPLKSLGQVNVGDVVNLRAVALRAGEPPSFVPDVGLARVLIPEVGQIEVLLTVDDPVGDDHGLGSYTYPTDAVFEPGVFDITEFVVGQDEENLVFRFNIDGPLTNPWGSPNGLALQTLDVYVDVDGEPGSGARLLLPGRNAALPAESAWDVAVWAEGWEGGVFVAGDDGRPRSAEGERVIIADPGKRQVTVRVPRSAFPEGEPTTWRYLGVVLSQDGFPAAGVWRVRDVLGTAEQWRLGGAPDDTNHTRIIDVAWPGDAEPTQEQMLSDYPSSQVENMDELSPDDFAQLQMVPVP